MSLGRIGDSWESRENQALVALNEAPAVAPSSGAVAASGMPYDLDGVDLWYLAEEASGEAQADADEDPFGFGWGLDSA